VVLVEGMQLIQLELLLDKVETAVADKVLDNKVQQSIQTQTELQTVVAVVAELVTLVGKLQEVALVVLV
jgi:hypothetical protein